MNYAEDGLEAIAARRGEEHIGIVAHITLGEEHLRALGALEKNGQVGHLVAYAILGGRDVCVGILVGSHETACLGDVCREGFGQIEFDTFVHDVCLSLPLVDGKTIGNAIVVGTHIDGDAALERECQLIGAVGDLGILQGHNGTNHFVHLATLCAAQSRLNAKRFCPYLKADGAVLQDLLLAIEHTVGEAVANGDLQFDVTTRRGQRLHLVCINTANAQQHEHKHQKVFSHSICNLLIQKQSRQLLLLSLAAHTTTITESQAFSFLLRLGFILP